MKFISLNKRKVISDISHPYYGRIGVLGINMDAITIHEISGNLEKVYDNSLDYLDIGDRIVELNKEQTINVSPKLNKYTDAIYKYDELQQCLIYAKIIEIFQEIKLKKNEKILLNMELYSFWYNLKNEMKLEKYDDKIINCYICDENIEYLIVKGDYNEA